MPDGRCHHACVSVNAVDVVERELLDGALRTPDDEPKVREGVLRCGIAAQKRERPATTTRDTCSHGSGNVSSVFMAFPMYASPETVTRRESMCNARCSPVGQRPIQRFEMLWIFERKGEQMRCEIRREGVGAGYEMIVTSPDGSQRMERFEETNDLIKRTLDLQRELLESGWRQPKPVGLVPA